MDRGTKPGRTPQPVDRNLAHTNASPFPDPLNIHKSNKYLNRENEAAPNGTIELLQKALRSASPIGQALRTLIHRVNHPQAPYTDEDLEVLMGLSIAQIRNEEEG